MIDLLNERGKIINEIREQLEKNTRNAEVQFTRFAQMQQEIDELKRNARS